MITIKDLSKAFNQQIAVNISDLHIEKNELVGLVGNNGAGKTTLLRLILDLYQADKGYVLSKGINVAQSEDWKIYTGAFIDSGFLIDFLYPNEYFNFIGRLHNFSKEEIKERLSQFEKFASGEIFGQKKYIRNFSAGNKQKIGIIGAMFTHPEILLLDEPFNFLDPSSQNEMKRLLAYYQKEYGCTLLISSHNLEHITEICSRVILLEKALVVKDLLGNDVETAQELQTYFLQ